MDVQGVFDLVSAHVFRISMSGLPSFNDMRNASACFLFGAHSMLCALSTALSANRHESASYLACRVLIIVMTHTTSAQNALRPKQVCVCYHRSVEGPFMNKCFSNSKFFALQDCDCHDIE